MLKRLLMILVGLGVHGGSASAMDFAIVDAPDGLRMVSATGPIAPGDAGRLAAALNSAGRDLHGNKRLVLKSVGGQVVEAFAMVAVMDRERVTTIVEAGAECASACAQILFLSGIHRFVREGGRLGLHSCYSGDRNGKPGKATQSTYCNDMIAQNALARGISYGSIMAFMQYTDPAKIRWFNAEEADCWGFTRWPPEANRGTRAGDTPPCLLRGYNGKITSSGEQR